MPHVAIFRERERRHLRSLCASYADAVLGCARFRVQEGMCSLRHGRVTSIRAMLCLICAPYLRAASLLQPHVVVPLCWMSDSCFARACRVCSLLCVCAALEVQHDL